MCKYLPQAPLVSFQKVSLYRRANTVTGRRPGEQANCGVMQSPPVGRTARHTAICVRDLAINTANILNWSVVPKPSTGRMLLSAKTCRGCRSLPKALKWDSAAFDFRLSTPGSMCLENHQFTFKETSFIESKAILSHIWH
ncbi:hypothetical protein N7449_010584 [Penicillium cf. viridicatum]|uniref:Uncharacterized protein n=1 Tax=Penicillium cf. viridicatum TaxID=2972119 RepID=A0A9W9J3H2_9EURO|nr:hypothetical protein N7449_010584 [Penicillium cf. viridicatum]